MPEFNDLAGFSSVSGTANDALLAGPADILVERKGILASGQSVVRGQVLGLITASGKYAANDSASADGSEDPVAISIYDVDASAADAEILVYIGGIFNETEMTFGGTDDADTVRDALRDIGIQLRKGMPA